MNIPKKIFNDRAPATAPHEVYKTLMADAKLRLLSAERVIHATTPVTGLLALDCEVCFLQVRRVIELVTFSALKREEGRYARLREQERLVNQRNNGDPSKDWQAPEILRRLVTLSPYALPIPIVGGAPGHSGVTHSERQEMTVSRPGDVPFLQARGFNDRPL